MSSVRRRIHVNDPQLTGVCDALRTHYTQPIFSKLVQELALKCDGSFPVACTTTRPIASGGAHPAPRASGNGMHLCLGFLYGLFVGRSRGAAQGSTTEEVESTLIKWSQVQGTQLQDRVCWPRLKHLDDRGLHKLLFFYHGDVSKLSDLVRQRIFFDSLTDLCRCLEEIRRDARLQVVCLKNRFDTDADVSRTAGYRDVLVRVRVCTKTTEELGVSEHVCELQLAHREMSQHLSPAQHERYLGYKNATIFRFYNSSTSLSWGSSRGIIGIYLSNFLGMLNRKVDMRIRAGLFYLIIGLFCLYNGSLLTLF